MNTTQIEQKAKTYALKKWGYNPDTTDIQVLYLDTAVVANSTEDYSAGYQQALSDIGEGKEAGEVEELRQRLAEEKELADRYRDLCR